MANKLLKLLSWRNLGILRYNAVWQNLAALFYIGFQERSFSAAFLGRVLAFAVFSTLMTGYGYLVNDLADKDLDRQHGKPNAFENTSRTQAAAIAGAVLLVGGLFSFPFWDRPQFWAIWLLWVLDASFYSLPPLRLKERGGWGLAATITAQQTLPTLLIFAAFGDLWSWGAVGFALFATVRGISSDVSHQMRDYRNDLRTGTRTFAVKNGYRTTQRLYAASLEAERLTLGGVLILIFAGITQNAVPSFPPLTLGNLILPVTGLVLLSMGLLMLIYLLLLARTIGRSWQAYQAGTLAENDPYNEQRQAQVRDALHIIHHTLPSVVLPGYLALLATYVYWGNVVFIVAMVLLYGLHNPKNWQRFLKNAPAQTR